MIRARTTATNAQIAALRAEMSANPTMCNTSPENDSRWSILKSKLDRLGTAKTLEQWKKSWKAQEKNVFGIQLSNGLVANMNAPLLNNNATLVNNALHLNNTPAANLNQSLPPFMQPPINQLASTSAGYFGTGAVNTPYNHQNSMQYAVMGMPALPPSTIKGEQNQQQFLSQPQMPQLSPQYPPKAEDNDEQEVLDDDIQCIAITVNQIQQPKDNISTASGVASDKQSDPVASKNEGTKQRVGKRSSYTENTAIALEAMDQHNVIMQQLIESSNKLITTIETINNENSFFHAQLLSLLTDISSKLEIAVNKTPCYKMDEE